MLLQSLNLQNFRCFTTLSLECDSRINLFVGKNGSGKTSILEAIYFSSMLRSFRTTRSLDLILNLKNFAGIDCQLHLGELQANIKIDLSNENNKFKKKIFVNYKKISSDVEYFDQRISSLKFYAISFSPADQQIVLGGPSERRLYLNTSCALFYPEYLHALKTYQRLCAQKKALLLSQAAEKDLEPYHEQLAFFAEKIFVYRKKWFQQIEKEFHLIFQSIVKQKSPINLKYINRLELSKTDQSYGSAYLNAVNRLFTLEKKRGQLLVGPHRDDWMFCNQQKTLAHFGSQGEIRSALLALKLAEVSCLITTHQTYPLLLLDDFSSELDSDRQNYLLEYIAHTPLQVFISSTIELPFCSRAFKLEKYQIKK